MSSPVHRYLFSPPSSPLLHAQSEFLSPKPSSVGTRSPLLSVDQSTSTSSSSSSFIEEITEFLLPVSPRARSSFLSSSSNASLNSDSNDLPPVPSHLTAPILRNANANANARLVPYADVGPGGFNSTLDYPSRTASTSASASGSASTASRKLNVAGPPCSLQRRSSASSEGGGYLPRIDEEREELVMLRSSSSSTSTSTTMSLSSPSSSVSSSDIVHSPLVALSRSLKTSITMALNPFLSTHFFGKSSASSILLPMHHTNSRSNNAQSAKTHSAALPLVIAGYRIQKRSMVRYIVLLLLLLGGATFLSSLILPAPTPTLGQTSSLSTPDAPFSMSVSEMAAELKRQQAAHSHANERSTATVGGKLVKVLATAGAPKSIVYDARRGDAPAPPGTYRSRPGSASRASTGQSNGRGKGKGKGRGKSTVMSPAMELIAVQSYLLSNPHHSLPPSLDSSNSHLDPMTVLGFDPDDTVSWDELKNEIEPVVIWASSETWSTPILNLLSVYSLSPPPITLSLSDRTDLKSISAIIARASPERTRDSPTPLITIGGKPIDGLDELLRLHEEGKLHRMLGKAGAVVDGKKKAEEESRMRQERLNNLKHVKMDRLRRSSEE